MRYYIADLHFFHENLNTKMDKRGFANVNAMNDYMLKQWNSKVRNRDEVVILGDLSWGKSEETNQLLQKLNGRLYLLCVITDSINWMQKETQKPICCMDMYTIRRIRDCWKDFKESHLKQHF